MKSNVIEITRNKVIRVCRIEDATPVPENITFDDLVFAIYGHKVEK